MNPWTKLCSPILEDDEIFPLWEIYSCVILAELDAKDWKLSGFFQIFPGDRRMFSNYGV